MHAATSGCATPGVDDRPVPEARPARRRAAPTGRRTAIKVSLDCLFPTGQAVPVPTGPTRVPQQERSRATQARLLEATVACLVEHGWSGTTTTVVATRAGLSRGTQ